MRMFMLILLFSICVTAKAPITIENLLQELSLKPQKHERIIKRHQKNLHTLSKDDSYRLTSALADSGWGSTIKLISHYGVKIDAYSTEKKTALHDAFLSGNYKKGKLLIASGCDPSISLKVSKLSEHRNDGLLFYAIQERNTELLQALAEANIDPNSNAGNGLNGVLERVHWSDSSSKLWKGEPSFLAYLLENTTFMKKIPAETVQRMIYGYGFHKELLLLAKHGLVPDEEVRAEIHQKYLKSSLPGSYSHSIDTLLAYPSVAKATHAKSSPLLLFLLTNKSISIKPELFGRYLDTIGATYETFAKGGKNYLSSLICDYQISTENKTEILKRINEQQRISLYSEILTNLVAYMSTDKRKQKSYHIYCSALSSLIETGATPSFEKIPYSHGPLLYFISSTLFTYRDDKKGYRKFLKLLLSCKVDVHSKDRYGRTPLMWTQLLPVDNELEKMLLEAGAKKVDEEYWEE